MHTLLQAIAKVIILPLVSVLTFAGYSVTQPQTVTVIHETPVENLGNYQPSGGTTYHLKNSIGSTNTSINLSSFKEPVSDIKYTMSILNSSIGYGTLEPRSFGRSEFISWSGITQNSDGSATLTGVTRGLPRSNTSAGCTTASTTLSLTHSSQSEFILSDNPCHFNEYAIKRNDEVITGSWTVPAPLAGGNPTTKTYVDGLVSGGSVSYNQIVAAGTAGETVSAGQILYLKQADGRWYKAAVNLSEASSTILSVAQGSGTSGNAITGGVLLSGLDSNQSGLTAGLNYFVGTTAGTASSATSTRVIGRGRTSTSLYFHPDFLIANLFMQNNTFLGSTTLSSNLNVNTASTTFSNVATSSVVIAATSSLQIGGSPAYWIGKTMFASSTSGSFPVPPGITKIWVRMVGGGGGGGSSNASTVLASGGAAGGYGEKMVDIATTTTASATTSIQYTIGAGGAGGIAGTGTTGGTTSFGPYFSCSGGVGGAANSGGQSGAGGTCLYATASLTGGKGDSAIEATGLTAPTGMGGGSSAFGSNGGFGAGGNGGVNGNGNAGTGGFIMIYW